MASEVTSDIKFELRGLKNLGWHAYLALKGLHEMNDTHAGDLSSIDERGFQPARKNPKVIQNSLVIHGQ